MKNLTFCLNNTLFNKKFSRPVIGFKKNNQWIWKTNNDLKMNVLNCIEVLKYNNVKNDCRVIYKGKNSFEWISWNIATNSLGASWVPLYDDQSDNYIKYIIKDSKPTLFIGNKNFENVNCINNSVLENNFNNSIEQEITVSPHANIANIIYTSGTTGNPKGVMLTHKNIISNIEAIELRFNEFKNKDLTCLNILPWAHIYGLSAELYYNLLNNNKIAISSGKEHFIKEIREINPDILYFVPRILDLIKSKLSFLDKYYLNFITPYVLKYIFGHNLITIFIGGAMLDNDTRMFYKNNNITLCEGYGCTETSPMISVNGLSKYNRNTESIGKILDNIVVKIIDEEILVNGPSVMKGYWGNENASLDAMINIDNKIFYKTGDLGEIDKNNFLYYKGRKSDNYKLTNGKFVNLVNIDNEVKKFFKETYVIFGDNKPYNIIITEKQNKITHDLLSKINNTLDNYLHIKDILYVENGTFEKYFTPKMSLKRKLFIKDYLEKINTFY